MLSQSTQIPETILGYKLKDRIGAGGYGEVWSAEAPGGLLKAVKLIFGFHDENRAQRELKSLNRIKEVRHPFLLSLERIDVVDGRLVVVTELAEKSLKDRFVECVRDGKSGVDRNELLGFLSDAADALDYLSDAHKLQHLDIKPENLLVVGGHVKVADFGLVKDIHDGTQSLMSGLTPTYAPPELFDGRPNRNSDQYSLAIVFQEMLTGTRPFDGQTAAQLASQHLNASPDLRSMPPADQNVLKRALAKSPDVRFANCREFVEELKRVKRTRVTRRPSAKRGTDSVPSSQGTLAVESRELATLAANLGEIKLPPIDQAIENGKLIPTLFIGIGETATNIIGSLKRRIRERAGVAGQTEAFRFLCVDTDARQLDTATQRKDLSSLAYDETLPTPLRTSAEYRERKDLDLRWISRRWIYNIPRNLQTQSLRPLGRLAFVDHHEAILGRLQRITGEMLEPSAIQATAQCTGLEIAPSTARIVIVASISGGVGSGMLCEMAYAARTILDEYGIEYPIVDGVLAYSTGRAASRRDVTTANAYCCLSEIHHYTTCPEGYPGDEASGLPPFSDEPTFDNTYLIHLGQDPLPEEYETIADEVAEYLYLDSATPCGDYFTACREAEPDETKLTARTLGICRSGGVSGDALTLASDVLAHGVLSRWRQPSLNDQGFDPRRVVANAFERLDLMAETLAPRCGNEIEHRAKRSLFEEVDEVCVDLGARIIKLIETEGIEVAKEKVEDRVTEVLGGRGVLANRFDAKLTSVTAELKAELKQAVCAELARAVFACLDQPGARVWQTQETFRIASERLQQLESRIRERQQAIRSQIIAAMGNVCAPLGAEVDDGSQDVVNAEQRAQAVADYGKLRVQALQNDFAAGLLAAVSREFEQFGQGLRELAQGISELVDEYEGRLEGQSSATSGIRRADILPNVITNGVATEKEALVSQLDNRIQEAFLNPNGGFQNVGQHRLEEWLTGLEQSTSLAARRVTSEFLLNSDFEQNVLSSVDRQTLAQWINESVALALPHIMSICGGRSYLITAVPRSADVALLETAVTELTTHPPKMIQATHGDVVYCYDVGGVAFTQVAAMLLHGCPEAGELVDRIHVRTDVDWTPIIRLS